MKEKDLLNGMSHIDETFLEEARTPGNHRNIWIRWGAAAACLCLLVSGGVLLALSPRRSEGGSDIQMNTQSGMLLGDQSSGQSQVQSGVSPEDSTTEIGQLPVEPIEKLPGVLNRDPEVSPIGENGTAFTFSEVRTDSTSDNSGELPVVTVIRSREELDAYCKQYGSRFQLGDTFSQQIRQYSDDFFQQKELVLVLTREYSGSVRHEITEFSQLSDGTWQITCKRIAPENGTADIACWHIFVEVEKGTVAPQEQVTFKAGGGTLNFGGQPQTH